MGSHVRECHGEEDQTIIVRKGVCLGRRGNDRKGPNCPAGLEQAAENRRLLQIGLGSEGYINEVGALRGSQEGTL